MKSVRSVLAGICVAALFTTPVAAQFDNVGSIDFPTSATGEAQNHFLRGVAILHSFGWKQAREQFHAAQELDPTFALAYWGESLAYNHPLVSRMNPDLPRQALQRLAPTREERLALAPTDREKGFLNAVEILWGEGDHVARRVGYMDAMADLYDRYPDDVEVGAFYSLAMLSAAAARQEVSQRNRVKAGVIALHLFEHNPNHPGLAHYTIHSFDSPMLAPLALEAAHRFADIAPAVSHARHMPTHIFIQHGMWNLVSYNNQTAYDAARDLWEPGDPMGDGVHALDWGQYGDLQMGDYEKARLWIERIETMAHQGRFLEGGPQGDGGQSRAVGAVSLLKSRYIVDTEDWAVKPITDDSPAHELLATGLSAYHLNDQPTVRAAEQALKTREGSYSAIMSKQVGALLHAGMGHADVAIGLMDEAEEMIEAMAPPRGSASPIKPVHELFGEILLDLDRPADAIGKFETSLLRLPNRPRSLLGLARAFARTNQTAEAADAYQRLMKVWEGRESFAGYQEAMEFVEATDRYEPGR